MKPKEIREKTVQELTQKLFSLKEELFNLKYQARCGKLEKPSQIGKIKRDVARINTIITEKKRSNG
ncbi:MAG: 50S ribosomal protein L29 [Candidatus Omnitrophica bacterium]|nr:50S ribosomal protein L29 [Candidatus Omnitrophota bacterium]